MINTEMYVFKSFYIQSNFMFTVYLFLRDDAAGWTHVWRGEGGPGAGLPRRLPGHGHERILIHLQSLLGRDERYV